MVGPSRKVIIKDATLREGLDVPGVEFSLQQKLEIARLLDEAHVPEIEVLAPGKVLKDLEFVKRLKKEKLKIRTSGLVYGHSPDCRNELEEISCYLDRFDILMPLSLKRRPCNKNAKISLLLDMLLCSLDHHSDVGIGFPHATQTRQDFLLKICREGARRGAKRITIYDTNGSSDPFAIHDLIRRLKKDLDVPLFFHAHNDLGLATANSVSAVYAGADGLDVTVNGLGDRAGNASLEQAVMNLYLKRFRTGIKLNSLRQLSKVVEKRSLVNVSKLAPIVGEYIFSHKSPGHFENLKLFEAFDPRIVGLRTRASKSQRNST
jgi:homocitrate synthase NifV